MLLKSIQLSKKIRCAMENARDVAVLAGGDVGEANDLHINTTGLLPIPLGVRNLFLN
jgi:hypothetical protein